MAGSVQIDAAPQADQGWPTCVGPPVPRYACYPTPDAFQPLDPGTLDAWMMALPAGGTVGLYVHVPFCRRLCWWCACRAERPAPGALGSLAATVMRELALAVRALPPDTALARLHLGGGTPLMLGADRLSALADAALLALPPTADGEIVVEAAAFDLDAPALAAVSALATRLPVSVVLGLGALGGRDGTTTRREEVAAVEALRKAGATGVTVEFLAGLPADGPMEFEARLAAIVETRPERIVLTPWCHAPDRSRRQAHRRVAPAQPLLAGAQTKIADLLLRTHGYLRLGGGTWVKPGDALLAAAASDRLDWGFDGLSVRVSDRLIGLGPSAISRLPNGLAQNPSATALWRRSVAAGRMTAWRGLPATPERRLAADIVNDLVCRGRVEIDRLVRRHGARASALAQPVRRLMQRAPDGAMVPLAGVTGAPGFMLTCSCLDCAQRCARMLLPEKGHDTPKPAGQDAAH
ncbi:MAG: hypothetical protein AAF899_11140 [Pseudomonadota bacterium]